MTIEIKRNHGYELIITTDNVRIVEDIETREYPKDENGKSIITLRPKRDIQTEVLQQFISAVDDMIYYRVSEFDSSSLIENLFEKLPKNIAEDLIKKLTN